MRPEADTRWVVAKSKELGFDLCGVTRPDACIDPVHRDEWLARGYAGEMRYLHDERRGEISKVLPDARSVIVCAMNYNSARPYSTEAAAMAAVSGLKETTAAHGRGSGWIARYAWGDDYHDVIGKKLDLLVAALREKFGAEFSARVYVDTGPISERIAAQSAGLGWLAKNTCLINRELGSFIFLGVILTSLELLSEDPQVSQVETWGTQTIPSIPAADQCGNCRLCLDACPTGALVEPYVMDARRCISYLTIELRGGIPEEFRSAMGWQTFGCDICQDVCPWNLNAPHTSEKQFTPRENLVAPELEWLLSLTQDDFRRIFKGSAVRRTKWRGLIRNACVAAGNALASRRAAKDVLARLSEKLAQLAASQDDVIAEHARWALAQMTPEAGLRLRDSASPEIATKNTAAPLRSE